MRLFRLKSIFFVLFLAMSQAVMGMNGPSFPIVKERGHVRYLDLRGQTLTRDQCSKIIQASRAEQRDKSVGRPSMLVVFVSQAQAESITNTPQISGLKTQKKVKYDKMSSKKYSKKDCFLNTKRPKSKKHTLCQPTPKNKGQNCEGLLQSIASENTVFTPTKPFGEMNYEERELHAFKVLKEKRLMGAYYRLTDAKVHLNRQQEQDFKFNILLGSNETTPIVASSSSISFSEETSEEFLDDFEFFAVYHSSEEDFSQSESNSQESQDSWSTETNERCSDSQDLNSDFYDWQFSSESQNEEKPPLAETNTYQNGGDLPRNELWEERGDRNLQIYVERTNKKNNSREARRKIKKIQKDRKQSAILDALSQANCLTFTEQNK